MKKREIVIGRFFSRRLGVRYVYQGHSPQDTETISTCQKKIQAAYALNIAAKARNCTYLQSSLHHPHSTQHPARARVTILTPTASPSQKQMNPHIAIPRQHGGTPSFGVTTPATSRSEGLRMPRFFKRCVCARPSRGFGNYLSMQRTTKRDRERKEKKGGKW